MAPERLAEIVAAKWGKMGLERLEESEVEKRGEMGLERPENEMPDQGKNVALLQ